MDIVQRTQDTTAGFGARYAVLNMDLMPCLIDANDDPAKRDEFISNLTLWTHAVHQKDPRPLTIFTTVYFAEGQPELIEGAPFTKLIAAFGSFQKGSEDVEISSRFVDDTDVVLQKTRWYAGAGNRLEVILRSHGIDTVVVSGLTLSGAVMATIYRLFDLDYNIYVISDNVLELPVKQHADFSRVMLDSLLGKMNLSRISLGQALEHLSRS